MKWYGLDLTMNSLRPKIAASLVLYNPCIDIIWKNIETYIGYIDRLIIIDNSIKSQQTFVKYSLEHNGKIVYHRVGKNVGVATALNIGATMAIGLGFDWLMLIDQDSSASTNMMESIFESISKFHDCGILAPQQITKKKEYIGQESEYTNLLFTMTSGSLLNLKAYQKCGPFEDKLFIDHVDNEYCLRLKKEGYKVIQCNKAVLNHSLGETIDITFFGKKYTITTHKPFRLYYFTRNGLYVALKYLAEYPSFLIYFSKQLGKNIFKAIFFEDNKMERVKMIYTGISDFLMGRYGKKYVYGKKYI